LDENLRFRENVLKVSDTEGKMVLAPQSSTTTPFLKTLKKTLQITFRITEESKYN